MSVKWTEEQQKVISLRNRSILVSAAAGSGKTAVLVERILAMLTDKNHPVDIDRLLIMTFTEPRREKCGRGSHPPWKAPCMKIPITNIFRDR